MLRHEEILAASVAIQRGLYMRAEGVWRRIAEGEIVLRGPRADEIQGEPASLAEAKARLLWWHWPKGLGAANVAAGGAGDYAWEIGRMEEQLERCSRASRAESLEEAKRLLQGTLSASGRAVAGPEV